MKVLRWSVTYTKHKHQKNKVYHDGLLLVKQFAPTQRKACLLDESEKLLEERYLNSCEDVKSGDTLEFAGYLVSVGNPVGEGSGPSVAVCATAQAGKAGCSARWSVLYAESVGRKKRFADGVLVPCPTNPRKLILNDDEGKVMGSVTLSKDDVVASGCKLTISPRIEVEVGSPIGRSPTATCTGASTSDREGSSRVEAGSEAGAVMNRVVVPLAVGDTPVAQERDLDSNKGKRCTAAGRTADEILQRLKRPRHVSAVETSGSKSPPKATKDAICQQQDMVLDDVGERPSNVQIECMLSSVREVIKRGCKEVGGGESTSGGSALTSPSTQTRRPQAKTPALCKGEVCSGSRTDAVLPFPPPSVPRGHDENLKGARSQDIYLRIGLEPRESASVVIPDTFTGFLSYKQIMCEGVAGDINSKLREFVAHFSEARTRASSVYTPRPSCQHGQANIELAKEEGPMKGCLVYRCPKQHVECLFTRADEGPLPRGGLSLEILEETLHSLDIDFYRNCRLFDKKSPGGQREKHGKPTVLLSIPHNRQSERPRGGVWIVSNNSEFLQRAKEDFVVVAEAITVMEFTAGLIQLNFIGDSPPRARQSNLFALRYEGASRELGLLRVIRQLEDGSTPLVSRLLRSPVNSSSDTLGTGPIQPCLAEYKLSEDQLKILHQTTRWASPHHRSAKTDVCFICGTSGSGTSNLLAIVVVTLVDLLKGKGDSKTRILVSAATDAALDRVLNGLLDHGLHDFLRVGSFRNTASNIFPYLVDSNSETDSVEKELERLLNRVNDGEKLLVEAELRAIRDGNMQDRQKKLHQVRVVGATCHDLSSALMAKCSFKICVMDECSEIPEPVSLMALSLFGCHKLVACGDMPEVPVRAGLKRIPSLQSTNTESSSSVMRSLSDRLISRGHQPVVLSSKHAGFINVSSPVPSDTLTCSAENSSRVPNWKQINGTNVTSDLSQDSEGFLATHSSCSQRMEEVLFDHKFQVQDFWEGYKSYCFGYYSNSEAHKRKFSASKMGQVIRRIHDESSFTRGDFDNKVRSTWALIEDHLQREHGAHCTDIRVLIDKYENASELSATADGRLLLELAKEDGNLASHPFAKLAIENSRKVGHNDIMERISRQLDRVNAGLKSLQQNAVDHP